MSYRTTPHICVSCGSPSTNYAKLTNFGSTTVLSAMICRTPECQEIARRLLVYSSDLSAVNADRKGLAEVSGARYYPFVSAEEWVKLKVK